MPLFTGPSSCKRHQLNHHLLLFHRDQIRENVLTKRYYCDVDIAHLIAYDEQLAHRLNNEPGEIIPLVSAPATQHILGSTNNRQVRSRHQAMHPKNRISLTAQHLATSPPTPAALFNHTNPDSWSDCHPRLPPCSHSRHRHRREHPVFKSDRPSHSMPKLPTLPKYCCHWRLCWRFSPANLRSHNAAWRRLGQMPYGSLLCCPREVSVH